jgi:hypothetical protein
MLSSGIDIKADPQLQDEFDRIVDGSTRWRWRRSSRATALCPRKSRRPPKWPAT